MVAGFLVLSAVAVLVPLVRMRLYPTWKFNHLVSPGMVREAVVQGLGHPFEVYTRADLERLKQRLRGYGPSVDFGNAEEVLLYFWAGDRLGLVLLSKDRRVIARVVVYT